MASASCTLFCSISHFLLLIFILIQVENQQSCPIPNNFTCPDNGELTKGYCKGGCELSCNANLTWINCRKILPNPSNRVLDISESDVTIAVDYTDGWSDDHCDAYSLFSSSFPSFRSVTIFKIGLGKKETFFGCPWPEGDDKYETCGSEAFVYGPYDKETANTTLIVGGCMQFHIYYLPPTEHSKTIYSDQTDTYRRKKTKGRRLWEIISPFVAAYSVLAVFMLIALIVYWRRRDSKSGVRAFPSRITSLNHTRSDLEEGRNKNGVTVFSYAELQEVTNNFDPERELGEGGFGVVYHGKLKDGREVAVKRMFEKNYRQIEQFKNEIQLLTNVRHPNLVTLYGSTSRHSRELLLVYEYIPNGTLSDHLHGRQSKSALLLWPARLNIAIQTASALCYLHYKDIIHRDVKSNNILLDKTFVAKVADFGLSRLFPSDVSHVSTAPQGTPGYLDPEYHQCYHLTDRSDVYSFGVVLVELISSREAVDFEREGHEVNLANYAMNRIQGCEFGELVDVNLGYDKSFKVRRMTNLVAELAFRCLQHEREIRPSMEEVLEELKRIESVDYEDLEAEKMG